MERRLAWAAALVVGMSCARAPAVEGEVTVRNGAAGHDAAELRFPTPAEGPSQLVVGDGCGGTREDPGCAGRPVAALRVRLNEATLHQGPVPAGGLRLEVRLRPVGGELNHLEVASAGELGSRARVVVAPAHPAGDAAARTAGLGP